MKHPLDVVRVGAWNSLGGVPEYSTWQNFSIPGYKVPHPRVQDELRAHASKSNHIARKLEHRMNKLLSKALATSSEASYDRAWAKFHEFMTKTLRRKSLPAKQKDVALYVTHLYEQGLKATSIRTHLSASLMFISWMSRQTQRTVFSSPRSSLAYNSQAVSAISGYPYNYHSFTGSSGLSNLLGSAIMRRPC